MDVIELLKKLFTDPAEQAAYNENPEAWLEMNGADMLTVAQINEGAQMAMVDMAADVNVGGNQTVKVCDEDDQSIDIDAQNLDIRAINTRIRAAAELALKHQTLAREFRRLYAHRGVSGCFNCVLQHRGAVVANQAN